MAHVAEQPMNLLIQYYHNANHPSASGREQIRIEATALWPTAAAMAAKEKEEHEAKGKDGGRKP